MKLEKIDSKKLINELKNKVHGELSGIYKSIFKGEGIKYERIREYQINDDFKFIEWNTSSRFNKLFIKEFSEERKVPMYLVVDISPSMFSELKGDHKIKISAELVSILSYTAICNNDEVSLAFFSDKIHKFSPLSSNRKIPFEYYLKVLTVEKGKNRNDLGKVVDFLNNRINKRSIIFIISDFLPFEIEQKLFSMKSENKLFLIILRDPVEELPPSKGIFKFKSAEDKKEIKVDFSEKDVIEHYKNTYEIRYKRFVKSYRAKGINIIDLKTNQEPFETILSYFKQKMS